LIDIKYAPLLVGYFLDMSLLVKLRQSEFLRSIAIAVMLLPVLIPAAQAIPLDRGDKYPTYLVICTGTGFITQPLAGGAQQVPANQQTSQNCPVCLSFQIVSDTTLPCTAAVPVVFSSAGQPLEIHRFFPSTGHFRSPAWPRAPPLI